MKVFGASQRATFEVKLWEDGPIDMLYGANAANPGDGRNAVIGIENADGTDALQFSMFEDLLDPNTAFRYEHVPSGLVQGVVTDANDGEPISGATITATPTGRSTTTGADGTYSLRLLPGSYTIEASATNYVIRVRPGHRGRRRHHHARLRARCRRRGRRADRDQRDRRLRRDHRRRRDALQHGHRATRCGRSRSATRA